MKAEKNTNIKSHIPKQTDSMFQLMPMLATDIAEVLAIEEQVQANPWTEGIFSDCIKVGYQCWVCKEDIHQIVGYLIQSIAAEEMHILNVAVHPKKQRINLGTLMVQYAEKVAIRAKAKLSFLEVRPKNRAAIRLYQKLGYRQIGVRKGYYPTEDGREDAIVMSKKLYNPIA